MQQTFGTVSSEEFRTRWGVTLDRVLKGEEIVVERHNRPMAALVNYDRWANGIYLTHQELRALLMAQEIAAKGEPTVTHEVLKQRIMEKLSNAAS